MKLWFHVDVVDDGREPHRTYAVFAEDPIEANDLALDKARGQLQATCVTMEGFDPQQDEGAYDGMIA